MASANKEMPEVSCGTAVGVKDKTWYRFTFDLTKCMGNQIKLIGLTDQNIFSCGIKLWGQKSPSCKVNKIINMI